MSEVYKFAAEVEAIRFEDNPLEVFKFLGFDVRGDKVHINAIPNGTPTVQVNQGMGELELTLTFPQGTELTLRYGNWLVRVGESITVLLDSEFQKIKVAI